MNEFVHERLDVYRAAIEFLVLADAIASALPRGRAYLAINCAAHPRPSHSTSPREPARTHRLTKLASIEWRGARRPNRRPSSMPAGCCHWSTLTSLRRVVSCCSELSRCSPRWWSSFRARARARARGATWSLTFGEVYLVWPSLGLIASCGYPPLPTVTNDDARVVVDASNDAPPDTLSCHGAGFLTICLAAPPTMPLAIT